MSARAGRRAPALLALLLAAGAVLWAPGAAQGAFGLREVDVRFSEKDGSAARQAGSHPFRVTTFFRVNYSEAEAGRPVVEGGDIKDAVFQLPKGFVGSATAVPRCDTVAFSANRCGIEAVVGNLAGQLGAGLTVAPLYNLVPPPGVPVRLGAFPSGVPLVIDATVKDSPDYNVRGASRNIPQPLTVLGGLVELWGVPASPEHDFARGRTCLPAALPGSGAGSAEEVIHDDELVLEEGGPTCPAGTDPKPLLTLPRACAGPLPIEYEVDPWSDPGAWVRGGLLTHDDAHPPTPAGFLGCGRLGFSPSIDARPTSRAAQSPSGLDFSLDVPNEGLTNPEPGAIAGADVEKTVVTLPEGMTVNPSQAEGLEVCSEADLERETLGSAFGEGCPAASKIGTIEVQTPLLEGTTLEGSLFVAEPYRNLAHDSLIALYVVIEDPALGVLVKQPIEVRPDPRSGRLVSTVEDMPQIPFSHFRLHFREGGRAPLITPPGCGSFQTTALLYPSSGNPPVTSISSFGVTSGPDESPCPSGDAPFHPGFEAGTVDNAAGRYSPFDMQITRNDGEQDLTKLSQVLAPGVLGRLAGIPYCPEVGIAQARGRTGEHGGAAELVDPSCPAASRIGGTEAGAGVGSQLTYVPGSLYLAGPWHGDPLSVVSITPAVAGPFDAGAVVVRFALAVDPHTAEVEVDGSASDPIPHILQGIPLNVRDLQVRVDRPDFTLNATSCAEERTRATLWGGGTVAAPRPDSPVSLSARYQAADCLSLGLRPRLGLRLRGGVRRGDHPALRAVYRPRKGDANLRGLVVRLPRSAFLDQAHIRTICTRVQFAAHNCPKGARYGYAVAWTPLLSKPLQGPVYLRSSNHKLPDLVFDLHGLVDFEASSRIDSVHGGIRVRLENAPDAPLSRALVRMRGGERGLIVNSRDLCARRRSRAAVLFLAHNGRRRRARPKMRARCARRSHGGHRHRRRGGL